MSIRRLRLIAFLGFLLLVVASIAVTLPPTRNPEILAQLETVRANWEEMHGAIHVVLESDPSSSAFVRAVGEVERLSPVILSQMDQAVQLYEAEAARKVARAQAIQISFLASAAALLIATLVATDRLVLNPITRLGAAARRIGDGDLETPVSVAGTEEIDQLARSFDEMRQSLAVSREELERWAGEFEQRVAARMHEITAIGTVAQAANHHTEIGPLLDEVLPLLAEITGASAAWVTLLDERIHFYSAGTHNLPPALEAEDRAMMRWPGCLCQRKLLAGELTAAVNILECERLHLARGLPGETGDTGGLRYHASTPIHAGSRRLGILNLTTADERVFDADELRLLAAVGDQLGVAIERARLYEQVKAHHIEEQAALLKLSQALLGETRAQTMMDTAVHMARETLGVEFVAIVLIDPDGQTFSARAGVGWPPEVIRQALGAPLSANTGIAHVIRSKAPLAIPDESRETRFDAQPWVAQMGIAASLVVPMLVAGKVIGGLVVNSRTPRQWTEDEIRLLSLIANDTAQALERAWQHAHAQERLERIAALHDIDVAITAPLTLQATLDVLLEKVTERLRVDCAGIALIHPETRELIYAAKRCPDDAFFVDGLLMVNEGIAGQVAHSGQPAFIADVQAEPRFVQRHIAERLGLVSYMAVPLRARDETIGVLELATREPHTFPPEEMDFLITLAGQAAIVLDNTRMYEQAVYRAAQARTLAESAGTILARLDEVSLWPAVAAARQALAADRAAVFLYNPTADRVTCPYTVGLSDEYVAEISHRFREVPGSRLLTDPRPVVIADAHTDPALAPVRDLVAREGFHSYAVFQLTAPGTPLGALVVYRDLVAPFSPDDIATGQTLAHIVAVALQNARLWEAERAQARRLAAIGDVVRQAASLDLDELLHRVVDLVQQTFGYYYVNVLLVDPLAGELVLYASATPTGERPYEGYRFKIGQQGITGWVAASGEPLLVNDVSREPRYHFVDKLADTQSELAVPILSAGQVIGVLDVQSTERDAFDAADLNTLQTLAGHLAVAIENARRYEETRQRAAELAVLAGASQTIQRGGDLAEVLDAVLRQACGLVDASAGSILLLDEAQERLYVAAQRGLDPRAVAEWYRGIPSTFGTFSIVLATGEVLEIPDARHDPRVASGYGPVPEALTNVPLLAEGRVIGVLIIERVPQDDSTRRVLRTLTEMAGVAIERARLFDETRRRVRELEALAHIASALRTTENADEMHPIILEATLQAMGAQAGAFFLLDAEAQEAYVAAASGYREDVSHLRLRIGQDLAGGCWQTGAPILTDDISQDPRLVMPEVFQDLHKALCFPLRTVEGMIGVLLICFTVPGQPTAAEANLMATISEMAANALHRATLHEQTRRDAVELALAYDTTLEGWSKALELRDQETEGHSLRVTEMTLKLARALGMAEEELVHLRRGALLHDIGKMSIPDSILFKPGALSDEEWAIMRHHPVFAYELLSPIPYLHPALDVPYCHHEKWDGTGYPRGLKGEQIPLAARIFAVADVWDALRSDRPYRPAWPEAAVREYIRMQAGKHFDPQVVEAFERLAES